MNSTLIEMILNNLMSLFPFVIFRSYQRGVRWTLGKNPQELGPGPHWKIWLWHGCEVYDVVDEVLDLPVQSVITKDKKLVCFSVNIGYRINDVISHCCNVQDFTESTAGIAMTHLAQRVREMTLEELEADLKKLEVSLEGTLTTRMKKWGTEVYSVGFTNFAEVPRQMRIFLGGHESAHSLAALAAAR
jgi:regulator of protease activity HflC (stomatin/prohibitin superfamily)